MPRFVLALALAGLLPVGPALAQVLQANSDATIRNRLCVGDECADDPSPDFVADSFTSSLELRDFRSRMDFVDTSSSSFPDTDWAIQFNEPDLSIAAGGTEYFAIRDESAGTVPFLIEDSTPTNAFYLGDNGDLGLGTSIPLTDLHLVDPGDPGITFEDTLTSRRWQLYGNGGGFYLFDPAASAIPFEIRYGAPDSAVYVANDGDTGLGTAAPDAALHVARSDNSAGLLIEDTGASGAQEMLKLSNNGGSYFTFENAASGTTWFFTHENASPNRFIIADAVADGPEMSLSADGVLTVPGGFVVGNTALNVPDYVFGPDYALRPLSEVQAFIADHKHLPDVPSAAQIAEQGLDMTDMQMRLLQKVEELTLYTLAQQSQIAALQAEVRDLREGR
ncbi:hypothetical protein ACOXXX_18355 [Thalassococcus sp. BH17M4-6]|uniref:hypothetical protein n=1 Tax=Thalassococcus sp. BH17M4-6 TaxID=3413148 RepID=UPI003BD6FC53